MRGIDTPVRQIRREIFREVAKVAYESEVQGQKGMLQIIFRDVRVSEKRPLRF